MKPDIWPARLHMPYEAREKFDDNIWVTTYFNSTYGVRRYVTTEGGEYGMIVGDTWIRDDMPDVKFQSYEELRRAR